MTLTTKLAQEIEAAMEEFDAMGFDRDGYSYTAAVAYVAGRRGLGLTLIPTLDDLYNRVLVQRAERSELWDAD